MKKELIVSAFLLLAVACIGWSSDQKEVLEKYNTLMEYSEEENWDRLFNSLTAETKQLLDEIAEIYTATGVPFDNQGEELLASLISDTDLLTFSETVVSIDFRNGKAYLLSGEGSRVKSYQFLLEGNNWKLDLVPVLNEFLADIMSGVPDVSSTDALPSYLSVGQGSCEFALRNELENLSIWNIYCSPSDSDSWGEDWLGSSILGSGAEMGIWLEAGTYDIRLFDSEENSYTLWEVELTEQGLFWQITALDRDEPI